MDTSAAAGLATAGAVTALAFKGLWFNSWLTLGVTLDIGILYADTTSWPPSLF